MSSVEDIRLMNKEQLCNWLRQNSGISDDKISVACKFISENFIDGANFFEYTWEMWLTNGMPGGIASSLVKIAEKLLKNRKAIEFDLSDLIESIPAPSSFAKVNLKGGWAEILQKGNNKELLVCHRYSTEKRPIPVTLICPVFGEFVENCKSIDISLNDCLFAMKLVEAMSIEYKSEKFRMDAFHQLFSENLGIHLTIQTTDGATNDGSINFSDSRYWLCILEVKNEKGEGSGDPYMQAIAYYLKKFKETPARGYQVPCIILDLCGYAFGVSGIVNASTRVLCDPLIPMHLLLVDTSLEDRIAIARLFKSLQIMISKLGTFKSYSIPATEFPGYTYVRDEISEMHLEYIERVSDHLLYKARDVNSGIELAVKFVEKPYPCDVHNFAHSIGYAPKLFYCIRCPPNYWMIVMEWCDARPITVNDIINVQSHVESFLTQLHNKKFVHGDFRANNLLIGVNSRLIILDFDWAGVIGKVVYPPFMNPNVVWPPGAETGKPILADHDDYWFYRIASGNLNSRIL